MRLVSYERDDEPQPAVLRDEDLFDITGVRSLVELIALGDRGLALASAALTRPASRPLEGARLLAPIPRPGSCVLATGWNYLAHFEEGIGRRQDDRSELPDYPSFFTKSSATVTGPYDPIPYDKELSGQLDSEAEIAIVFGRSGRNIPAEEAHRYIFGYTLANDVTARDIQRRHGGQWFKGKSIDGTCPLGPWLVTADELDHEPIDIRCTINGEVFQEATTNAMIFSIAELVASLSQAMTLQAGDILLTGTPDGVGYARTPPRFLQPGDEVVVSSRLLGELRNRVVEQNLTSYDPSYDPSPGETPASIHPGPLVGDKQ